MTTKERTRARTDRGAARGAPRPKANGAPRRDAARAARGPRTLALDIGGTGLKGLVLDAAGAPLNDRVRVATPRPAEPTAVLAALAEVIAAQPPFDRVSVGFPGVVVGGVVRTAPNLDGEWAGFDMGAAVQGLAGKPTRVLNDAAIQGFGAIEGRGVELCLTLGTGVGASLFVDGHCAPLELGHHPWRKGQSYEDRLDERTRKEIGTAKWSRRVRAAVDELLPVFNPRVLYLGGGNAKRIEVELPPNVKIVSNDAGLLGGIALWRDDPHG
jgi:polyphosphate glucokinase